MQKQRFSVALFMGLLGLTLPLAAQEPHPSIKFLGAQSCSASSCHGGADEKTNQLAIWSRKDFHSRSYTTLTTARSQRITETLKITDATKDTRCTICHAPLHEVPAARFADDAARKETFSCETCHGAAEGWLRSHTRTDFTHANRVAVGMRDLKNLYVRANSCVACHQTISTKLLVAGHPELLFELDGQSVTQPKHWREAKEWSGAQAWLVGQAAALREMSWQLAREPANEKLAAQWNALLWLLKKTDDSIPNDTATNAAQIQKASDELAQRVAAEKWSAERTRQLLSKLAATHADFRDATIPQPIHARRAERLVLALDRLTASLGDKTANTELNDLFKLAQSLPDFDSVAFAAALEKFTQKQR